jgi:N-acetylneuraminate lyase
MPAKFGGVLPAVVTPFDDGGNFDERAFERLVEFLYAAGIDGLYVCGQTGEGMQQPPAQRRRVAEAAVRLSPPGKQVIIHVGAQNTAIACDLARHAESAGAAAVSSLAPSGPYSFDEVVAYYETLARTTSLPLFVYHFPAGSPVIRTIEHIERICQIPRVIGLKFTDMDLYMLGELKRTGAVIFNGADEVFAAGLLMGADGGIGSFYNIVPRLFVEAFQAARRGDWERARCHQSMINRIIRIGLRYPGHSAIKQMLAMMGLDCGQCLAPRRPLAPQEERQMRADLIALELPEFQTLPGSG